MSFDAKAFLKTLSQEPGVYRMFDAAGTVIYVGKAKNLNNRVSSYFRGQQHSAKTRALVSNIANIEVTVTHTEMEALILENHLIKEFQPKYNILLRDDKSYPYIVLTDHLHPRLTSHRGARTGKADYFGPFPNASAVWQSLKLMQKLFPVRQCEDGFYQARTRPCLQYQIKRCSAPCVGKISDADYQQQVQLAKLFLQGKNDAVIHQLVANMEQASMQLQFEQAAIYRDQIATLRKVQEQQTVSGSQAELDIIGFHFEGGVAAVHVLFVRDHKVLGSKNYFPSLPAQTDADEVLQAFVEQFYLGGYGGQNVPREIVLARDIEDALPLAEAVSQAVGYKVNIKCPQRGEKAQYLGLANKNAQTAVQTKLNTAQAMQHRYDLLGQALSLDLSGPLRMECFDISHTMGEQTIASCVVFNEAGPWKAEYRRFNVTGITPGDDYAAMAFAMQKRYGKLQDESRVPDIIVIDGGKGQLAQAEAFFADWPLTKAPLLLGVAKGVTRKAGLETLFLAGGSQTLSLAADSAALHLLQHIRDEAHRFAITGHRNKRDKAKTQSPLQDIAGVGPKRRQALLKYLGGWQGVAAASMDELAKVPGISRDLAETIYGALHPK